ncbi:MAG: CTP synthase (glutamine hydrolyzing) [Candidatus Abyssobacteria bacterium SURF_5]|uniref:CTP synthase n=1 Tax=Abyssobacteria bacterium (strain SURF_5) TaxID=2093360 RepID=A0A3A4NAC2_ABYX5|nr:MAG: CTP synthase (glutamine hydrolyzing) [Candidatus Abyssubacteria bacterium SURF_5]
MMKPTKWIVVTGGVLSGLGKGVVSASIGRLLVPTYKVIPIKCDGYLNVDPGTMNPVEHGEVFVLDDGGEVDLDFGHYERFLNISCKSEWNLTSGKIFQSLVEKERRGDFLGKTVQVIPHVTGEIRARLKQIARKEQADVVLVEIGGTVGDIENLWFLEAVRELSAEVEPEDILFVHLGLVPVLDEMGQQKTKPMQQSILFLRERGLIPQVIIGRSKERLTERTKMKIHWLCNVPTQNVISDPHLDYVYELPVVFEEEGLRRVLAKQLNLKIPNRVEQWKRLVNRIKNPKKSITIAICGKYTELADSYISIEEALVHSAAHLNCKVNRKWVETTDIERGKLTVQEALRGCQGVIVAGGFGARGAEGKISVIKYARENNIPFLGLCYGLQLAVVEFARNVCGLKGANSREICTACRHHVIDYLPEQIGITNMGGTMRLGGHDVIVKKGTRAYSMYGNKTRKRFRHRNEVNPKYIKVLEKGGMIFSGKARGKPIMQIIELKDHPFFMASQFHPELTSTLDKPSKMFYHFVETALQLSEQALPKPQREEKPIPVAALSTVR